MIVYMIKSIVCAALLLLAYHLFLEKERIHTFKRFYLLFTTVLVFMIPAISFKNSLGTELKQDTLPLVSRALDSVVTPIQTQIKSEGFKELPFLIAYIVVTFLLLFRYIKNVWTVYTRIKETPQTQIENATLIFVNTRTTPHTFLNYIFISEPDAKNKQILAHELTHSRQRHSLDILFIELVHCVFWFNPVLFFVKKAIRLNHEFLADETVIEESGNISGYQQLLLDRITGPKTPSVVSAFNYSLTKKRFTMMTRLKNKHRSIISIAAATITSLAIFTLSINMAYSQAPTGDEYTIFKDGKWQNMKLTVNPAPVGGKTVLMQSFQRILTYPKSAKASNIEGEVAVMFEVNTDGKVTACKVIKQLQHDCDATVINVLKQSNLEWTPAELNGEKYISRFVFPVKFSIGDSQLEETFDPSTIQAKALNTLYLVASSASN